MKIPLQPTGAQPIELRLVYNKEGKVEVVDIFEDNERLGSRRTIRYAIDWLLDRGKVRRA